MVPRDGPQAGKVRSDADRQPPIGLGNDAVELACCVLAAYRRLLARAKEPP
jgi:hypothetical protein